MSNKFDIEKATKRIANNNRLRKIKSYIESNQAQTSCPCPPKAGNSSEFVVSNLVDRGIFFDCCPFSLPDNLE